MSQARPIILLVLSQARLREIYHRRAEREGFTIEVSPTLLDAERRAVSLRPGIFMVEAELIDTY